MGEQGTNPASGAARATRVSRRRSVVFVLITAALPLILVGAAEAVLRVCGLGGYPTTIRRVAKTDGGELCITDAPGPASYFFANRSKPGSINQCSFLDPKPAGTIRILAAGESAMQGYPQPMGFASTAFLRSMLSQVWPGRRVEVINLGTTAVASFPVLGILTEALEYQPDLVVIYCGNNEYFGAYGVASLHSAGRSPGAIKFQRWVRSLAVVQGIGKLGPKLSATDDRTLMEAMIGRVYIGPRDAVREDAARNFRVHLSQMVDRCKAKGVPVIVCTLACNEKDLAPIGACDETGMAEGDRKLLDSMVVADERRRDEIAARAAAEVRRIAAAWPGDARARYFLGRALLNGRDADRASDEFQAAIDLDPMPWRAPSALNDAIRQLGFAPGVVLCDVQGEFRAASPEGSIGWELMDDHVHPSLRGQWLLARSVVRAMGSLGGALRVDPAEADRLAPFEQAAAAIGDNPFDRYGVAHTLRVLASVSFFKGTSPWMQARYDAMAGALYESMPAEVKPEATAWQKPATHAGARRPLSGMAGQAIVRGIKDGKSEAGRASLREAEGLFGVAGRHVPAYTSLSVEYEYFRLACRLELAGGLSDEDRVAAGAAVERGKLLLGQGRSETGQTERYVGRLLMLRGEYAEAAPFLVTSRGRLSGTDLVAADKALVECYLRMGKKEEAAALIADGIRNGGQFAPVYRAMEAGLKK